MSNALPAPRSVVVSLPGICGGHAILKGHRIEVSNLVDALYYRRLTLEQWIESFDAGGWITPPEIVAALSYCAGQQCLADGITCCNCTLNPESDPEDKPRDGWNNAVTLMKLLRKAMKSRKPRAV